MSTWGRDGASTGRSARGQSAILGLVLLIGVVATASVGILIIAADTTEELEQQTENERIEQAFVELSQKMATTSVTGDTTEVIDFDAGEHGAVVKKGTGTMTIEYGDNEEEEIHFGTIEFEGDDGTRIAYEAGGVFRETGNETRVVSAPPIHYDGSETFSFPIVETASEGQISSGDVLIRKSDRSTGNVDEIPNVIDGSSVKITVQSEYYLGWRQYFERQAGENAIDSVDPGEESVTVKLENKNLDGIFDNALTVNGNGTIGGTVAIYGGGRIGGELNSKGTPTYDPPIEEEEEIDIESIDEQLTTKIEEVNDSGEYDDLESEIEPGYELTAGKYHTEYFDIGGEHDEITLNVSDDDIVLVIEDGIETSAQQKITVEGVDEGNRVEIYLGGDAYFGAQNSICVETCYNGDEDDINADGLHIYGGNDFDLKGGVHFEGIIYAPSAELNEAGNQDLHGAVVVDSLDTSGNMDFTHDPELEGGPIMGSGGTFPNITYFNVAKHEVDVEQ